jgi:hypothetical protein
MSTSRPLISCLCPTYGRFTCLRESLACWMRQTWPYRELIILNQHPEPIACSLPGVRVYNEPDVCGDLSQGLAPARYRLYELAEGDLVTWWEDDDLFCPWDLQTKVEHGHLDAWAPQQHWYSQGLWGDASAADLAARAVNVAECSIVARRDALDQTSKGVRPLLDPNCPWPRWVIHEVVREPGVFPSYVYRWCIPVWHVSGAPADVDHRQRIVDARRMSTDGAAGRVLAPRKIGHYFDKMLTLIPPEDRSEFAWRLADAFF